MDSRVLKASALMQHKANTANSSNVLAVKIFFTRLAFRMACSTQGDTSCRAKKFPAAHLTAIPRDVSFATDRPDLTS